MVYSKSLSNDVDNGSEKVAKKEFASCSWILKDSIQVQNKKRKENSWSYVHLLHKTLHQELASGGFTS